jgi:hypothetical protein
MKELSLADIFRTIKPLSDSTADRIEVAYWWSMHHHGGQGSQTYKDLCILDGIYSPGICQKNPHNTVAYDALCDLAECDHERFDGPL